MSNKIIAEIDSARVQSADQLLFHLQNEDDLNVTCHAM